MLKKSFKFFPLLALTALPTVPEVLAQDSLNSCLPSTSGRYLIEKHEVVGKAQDVDGSRYYLVNSLSRIIQRGQEQQSITHVIEVSDSNCSVVFANPMGDFVSLANFMPKQVARDLVLSSMNQEIEELGSKQAFLDRFYTATKNTKIVLLTEEELWALQELGYVVPRHQTIKLTP